MVPPLARSMMPSQALHPRGSVFAKSSRRVADGAHAHAQALRHEQGVNGAAGGVDQPSVAARTSEAAGNNNNHRTNNRNSTRQPRGDRGSGGEGRSNRSSRSRFVSDALQMLSNRSSNRGRSGRAAEENGESGRGHGHGHGHGHGPIGDDGGASPCPQKPLASFRSGSYSPGQFAGNA
jgi:hypothetical protein